MDVIKLVSFICTSLVVTSAIIMAFGWGAIRRKQTKTHERLMLVSTALATLFFILYVIKTTVLGSTQFGGPEEWKIPYLVFLFFHIALSTTAAVMGVITLVQAYKRNYAKHKKIGRATAIVWFSTAVTGVAVYLLLYVLYEGVTVPLNRLF